ncbi:GntR family transcriptional regulator [Rubrobacter marinus]|uniref:GntR family transcriptional regulator n=1 Tax=Rubrobacter marinus TaxID=2653852 RepID=UPI001A9EB9D8|nr:GntR family transcriptional regulator [Rubrobacter marinus]
MERLRSMIMVGEYEPWGRLVEEQLARSLGVSRTPVRQALTRLEAEGLVEIVPNKGAVVRGFGMEDVWDVYDLRALLEGHAARRAAGRITKKEFERLRAVAAEMEAVEGRFSDRQEETRWLVARNQEFHGGIVEAGRNRRLRGLLDRTVELPLVFKAFYWYTPEERQVSNHHHRQLLRSLEAGDGERAEIVMREHVYEGRDTVIRALEEGRE